MEQTKRPVGRPPGRKYRQVRSLVLADEDEQRARALAARWGVSIAEAFRRAMREAAKRERLG